MELYVFYGFHLFISFNRLFLITTTTTLYEELHKGLARLWLRNHGHTKFQTKTSQLIVRIYKLSHTALRTYTRSRSPSHLFTGKSEQNILRPRSREDQAGVIHAISPIWMKLSQIRLHSWLQNTINFIVIPLKKID